MEYNVRDYGALGNGLADDTSAIQAAVDAAHAAGGGTVYIPAGNYIVNGHTSSPSLGCIMLYSDITVHGDGMGLTTVKLKDGWNGAITGIFRDQYGVGNHDITVHDLTIDGNRANTSGKIDGWFNGGAPGSPVQDTNITLDHVEIKDCEGYGFDPHEITSNLVITNCISHGNGLDGFTLDYQIDAHIDNNVAYDNDRHGFNIVTSTHDIELSGNVAYGNGGEGIMIQRGSDDIPAPHDIVITGGEIYGNALDGIAINMSDRVTIDGVDIHDNAQRGVRIRGSNDTVIQNSTFHNDSQGKAGGYDEISISAFDDTNGASGKVFAANGTRVENNAILADGAVHALYSVRETGANVDFTTVIHNTMQGESNDGAPRFVGLHSTFDGYTGNNAPIARPDSFSDPNGAAISGNVLIDNGNGADSDPNGDSLSVKAFSGATAHGSVSVSANGGFSYTPQTGFTGQDGFTYTLKDGHGGTAQGSVTVAVGVPQGAIMGSEGADTINGGSPNDVIYGLGGNDTLTGGDGNDTLHGGSGNDFVSGGKGDDVLYAEDGTDVLHGNSGADTLYAGAGFDTLYGESENDLLVAGTGSVTMTGGGGADIFKFMSVNGTNTITDFRTSQGDKIDIAATLHGYNPATSTLSDFVHATASGGNILLAVDADGAANGAHFTNLVTLEGITKFDVSAMAAQGTLIVSASGAPPPPPPPANSPPVAHDDSFNDGLNATLTGNVLADNGFGADSDPNGDSLSVTTFSGATAHGNLVLQANGGFSYTPQSGFTGQDAFSYTLLDGHGGSAQGHVSIAVGTAPGSTLGTSGDDTISGTSGANTIYGLGGNDTVNGGDGNDSVYGGDGNDAINGGKGDDTLYGENGNDTLHGNSGNDTLFAGPGTDILFGDSENDTLVAGTGSVTMSGGSGLDVFKFMSVNGTNLITDFHASEGDKIDIANVLHGYDHDTGVISDFVHATSQGGGTVLSVDADGSANGAHFTDLVTLQSITHFDVAMMMAQGNLVV